MTAKNLTITPEMYPEADCKVGDKVMIEGTVTGMDDTGLQVEVGTVEKAETPEPPETETEDANEEMGMSPAAAAVMGKGKKSKKPMME